MATVIKGGVSTRGNVTGGISRAETVIIKEIEFNNKANFPEKGYHRYLYVALDEKGFYLWNDSLGYVPMTEIDDSGILSMSKTWSNYKINNEITKAVDGIECATDEDIQNLF